MPCNLSNEIIYKEEITAEKIHTYLIKTNEIICDLFKVDKSKLNKKFAAKKLKEHTERITVVFNGLVNSLMDNKELEKIFIEEIFKSNLATKEISVATMESLHKKYKVKFNWAVEYSDLYAQCLSLFLMVLHFEKIIHLPFKFKVPYILLKNKETNKRKRLDLGINYYPLMYRQIRELDSQNLNDEDSKFLSADNKELLISYGSKLFLSLGWVDFSDVSIKDLLEFRLLSEDKLGRFNSTPPYSLLIKFLNAKNPSDFNIGFNEWRTVSGLETKNKNKEKSTKDLIKNINFKRKKINANNFSTGNLLGLIEVLPEYKNVIENWNVLEKSYINKRKMESYKTIQNALGYLNMYLFLTLPKWYGENKSNLEYPKNPTDLKVGSFISRVIDNNEIKPPTLLEFLYKVQEEKEIKNEYLYTIIKNLEKFFDFIETYSEELPGCKGFTQPISSLDYPKVTRSVGTNKGLIPRHLFGNLINYIEVISAYNDLVNEKICSEVFSAESINKKLNEHFINTISIQNEIGFVPLIFINKEMIILREIPNLLDLKATRLKNGKILKIHYPHILNHILVALQTGIRGNHIQWLDAEKFDSRVKEDGNSFSTLYVNTDKSKTSAWTPIVHKKVIDILRSQLRWRNLIDNQRFNEKKFYNNNQKTKWGSFYPLFSYTSEGLPYSDTFYLRDWIKILTFFQELLKKSNLKYIELTKLLPKGVSFNEFNMDVKLKEIGKNCGDFCELRWTSDITPHSARVSVVSNYITALPADVIGKYITGQTEAVVHHYVKLDPNYLTEIENGQKEGLAKIAIQKEFDQLMGKESNHPIFADKENSNIAKSIAINKMETIAQYGCISLNLKEECKNGVDVLIEESNVKLAFNKTEICPYNNNCPSDLIKELKGLRRCGVCPYAVRSIDHLPAIAVKKRQMMELLEEIENKLSEASSDSEKYTIEELDGIEEERQRITEELLGWIVSEEMLEANRKRLSEESSSTQYVVKKPEILIQNLQQVSSKEGDVEYLITRLSDCESFPGLDTPMVRAKFDLLRRKLLAKLGDFQKAFDMKIPTNPSQECLGLLKEVVNRYGLTQNQTVELLSTNMLSLEHKNEPLLGLNYGN